MFVTFAKEPKSFMETVITTTRAETVELVCFSEELEVHKKRQVDRERGITRKRDS